MCVCMCRCVYGRVGVLECRCVGRRIDMCVGMRIYMCVGVRMVVCRCM